MATMINCAQDWTYDKYVNDIMNDENSEEKNEYFNEVFAGYMKRSAQRFLEKWNRAHDGKQYAPGYGYVGDAFADALDDICFSDFYKDAYFQRPHLPRWFYVHPLGLPMQEDTARTFCANPIERAMDDARECRKHLF